MPKSTSNKDFISLSLAIFSMLFGAGNLIYPLVVGKNSGEHIFLGVSSFILTSVLLPLLGLVGIILFNGNYVAFFNRLGNKLGSFFIFSSIVIIGPLIGIPRIVTLSHTMIAPFIPFAFAQNINPYSSFIFCILFLGITFLATFRENKIVDVLGKYISPLLLVSLAIIFCKGLLTAQTYTTSLFSPVELFKHGFITGYETLDLLATIFFASIIISILKQTFGSDQSVHDLAIIGLKTGLIGVSLLGIVYYGMGLLGAFHGHGFESVNSGELFRLISFSVLGSYGAIIISTAVLMACFSTAIALSAVVAEYVQHNTNLSFISSLIITLLACVPLSTIGLDYVLKLTAGPITYIGYPVLIVVTLCNIGYKLFGFNYIKAPVFITFVIALSYYTF